MPTSPPLITIQDGGDPLPTLGNVAHCRKRWASLGITGRIALHQEPQVKW